MIHYLEMFPMDIAKGVPDKLSPWYGTQERFAVPDKLSPRYVIWMRIC